ASSRSRMAPTAPKVPSISAPVAALSCGASAATRPCAAPPERRVRCMDVSVIASEAKQSPQETHAQAKRDCFASLAMTGLTQLLVHAVVEELLRQPADALRRDDAEAAMLEERPRRDARLGEQPQQAVRPRTRLHGPQEPAGDALALMVGMHIKHVDQAITRDV